jgi:hypothetical protein
MKYIAATPEYGLVVRKSSLMERGISQSSFSEAMHDIDILEENDELMSYGPLFGQEAFDEIKTRLANIGLSHVDDYLELNFLLPDWLRLGVALS